MAPFPGDWPDLEKSGMFLHLNTNKESVVIDIATPEGAGIARTMVSRADVVVESSRPGTMATFGLGPDDLTIGNPRLVFTSVTPFGQTGPYRDWEMTEIVASRWEE